MEYKKGDKLYCKKHFDWGDDRVFENGEYYEIRYLNLRRCSDFFMVSKDCLPDHGRWFDTDIKNSSDLVPEHEKNFRFGYLWEYFCDEKE